MADAMDWIDTDAESCREDVVRLGLDGATKFNTDMAKERAWSGDDRWVGITVEQMRDGLEKLTTTD